MNVFSATWNEDSTYRNVAIWHVQGDLDVNAVGALKKNFEQIIEKKCMYVIAEMRLLTHIDPSGLVELLECKRVLAEQGGDLVCVGLSLDVKSCLSTMGALYVFKLHHNIRTALQTYQYQVTNKAEKIKVSFPPELSFVPPVRQLISRVAMQKNYSLRDAFRLETIADEICNNAVEHGSVDTVRDIDVLMKIDKNKVEIEVNNLSDPKKLDALKAISSSILGTGEKRLERGRGFQLVKMLSNDLSIDFSGNGTTVHITKLREV
jgi:anti-anti-sigma factor